MRNRSLSCLPLLLAVIVVWSGFPSRAEAAWPKTGDVLVITRSFDPTTATSFPWALFAAGARSTVVSQFRVESKSTTALLIGFHRRLAAGTASKAEALRAAALDLLHTPRYAHPYYWAGFILVGDPN
jgi:hypothetical protein